MNANEYPHPERLIITDRNISGGANKWQVLEVFSVPATRVDFYPIPINKKIDIALLTPKNIEPGDDFQMKLMEVHEDGLSTQAEFISLNYCNGSFQLEDDGWAGIYLFTTDPDEQQSTQEQKDMGYTNKIKALEDALRPYKDSLTKKPAYLPVWQDAARKLAPAVAKFYLSYPETLTGYLKMFIKFPKL